MGSKSDLSPELGKLRTVHRQFYLTVYTSTDAIENGYECGGGLDLGLNERGMDDARKLSRKFKKNPLKVKKIVSGPELRTIQLADFLHDEMKGRMVVYREFADQFMGDLEGKPLIKTGNSGLIPNPPRGETEHDFTSRVHQGLVRILQEKELCLLATHPRVALKIFEWFGIGHESIKSGELYAIDLPTGTGHAHFRQV